MDPEKLKEIIKIVGLGEKVYLDIDSDDEKTNKFIEEIFLNHILTNLAKEKRTQFYDLFDKNTQPQNLYNFLLDNIESFEPRLVDRIKLELSALLLGK